MVSASRLAGPAGDGWALDMGSLRGWERTGSTGNIGSGQPEFPWCIGDPDRASSTLPSRVSRSLQVQPSESRSRHCTGRRSSSTAWIGASPLKPLLELLAAEHVGPPHF